MITMIALFFWESGRSVIKSRLRWDQGHCRTGRDTSLPVGNLAGPKQSSMIWQFGLGLGFPRWVHPQDQQDLGSISSPLFFWGGAEWSRERESALPFSEPQECNHAKPQITRPTWKPGSPEEMKNNRGCSSKQTTHAEKLGLPFFLYELSNYMWVWTWSLLCLLAFDVLHYKEEISVDLGLLLENRFTGNT